MRLTAAILVLLSAAPAALAQTAPTATAQPPAPGKIARITIDPQDVFDLSKEDNFLFRAANFFHITTKPHVVRNLLLFEEGDPLRQEILEETERNLRDVPAFEAVAVTATARPDGDYDVRVTTRDKWTLAIGAGVGYVGGIAKGRFVAYDANILGLGKQVSFALVERTDRSIVSGSYFDPSVLGTRHELYLEASASDLGLRYAGSFERPFFARETPYAYGIEGVREDSDIEYYRDGDVTAEVHRDLELVGVSGGLGWGPTTSVKRLGIGVEWDRALYDAPTGEDQLRVRWPRNRDTLDVVLRPSIDRLSRWEELERLDTNLIVEDIALGWRASGALGEQTRWDARGTRAEAIVGAGATFALRPFTDQIVTLDADWFLRHDGHAAQRNAVAAFVHHYVRLGRWQTIAWNVDVAAVVEREDLDPQLTLGEDNGLRGYPARQFAGTRRLRANLEDRIFTSANLLSFYLGFVVFADAGLVWDDRRAPRLEDVKPSVGAGFRVFSAEFLKRNVLRLDIAFPLDPDGVPGVSVSVSAGQVFTLFGQTDELSERF